MPIGNCYQCKTEVFYHLKVVEQNRLCHECYIPKSPTFGWLLSRYMKKNLCNLKLRHAQDKYKNNKNALENFLREKLNFKRATKEQKFKAER